MAESDSFIQEVSEEVRRDRMYAVWRRYGPWLIALIVVAVLIAAGRGWYEGRQEARKAELGGAMLEADAIDDPAEASTAFLALAEEESAYDYPVLARLRAAAALMQAGQLDEAEEQYEAVKATADVDPRFSDLAELRIVMMRSESMDPGAMLDRLAPLTIESSVWRLPALEYEAAAHLRNDDPDAALASLRAILAIPQITPATQGRIGELIAAVEATREEEPAKAPAAETGGTETEEPPETDASDTDAPDTDTPDTSEGAEQ